MQNDLPIIQRVYDFYKLFYQYLDHFPKKSRGVLGQKIETIILELLESITRASFAKLNFKSSDLQTASIKLDFLKILVRLSYELRVIDQKKYLTMEEKLIEIGKMLGGWIKSEKA